MHEFKVGRKRADKGRRPYGRLALMAGALLFSAYFGLKAAPGSPLRDFRQQPVSSLSEEAAVGKPWAPAASFRKALRTKPIEQIRLGDRV